MHAIGVLHKGQYHSKHVCEKNEQLVHLAFFTFVFMYMYYTQATQILLSNWILLIAAYCGLLN